jgi:hypothetical protein
LDNPGPKLTNFVPKRHKSGPSFAALVTHHQGMVKLELIGDASIPTYVVANLLQSAWEIVKEKESEGVDILKGAVVQ